MRRRMDHGGASAVGRAHPAARSATPRVRGPMSTTSLTALQRAAGNHAASELAIQREVIGERELAKGTLLYHGTKGNVKWWLEDPYPKNEGEDGGLSFTLDPEASPKTRNATVLLVYKLENDVTVQVHSSKGSFRKSLKEDESAICYTAAEEEVVMKRETAEFYLDLVEARPQASTSSGATATGSSGSK